MKRTFIIVGAFLMLSCSQNASAQSTLNSTGGTYLAPDFTEFDWSVGEIALVNTFYGPKDKNIIVTQGLLQNDISTPEKQAEINLANNIQVFPNPASSFVTIQFTSISEGTMAYRLMDMTGKIIANGSSPVKQGIYNQQVSMTGLAAASYMLEIRFKNAGGYESAVPYKIEKLN